MKKKLEFIGKINNIMEMKRLLSGYEGDLKFRKQYKIYIAQTSPYKIVIK